MSDNKAVPNVQVERRIKMHENTNKLMQQLSDFTGLDEGSILHYALKAWSESQAETIAQAIRDEAERKADEVLEKLKTLREQ